MAMYCHALHVGENGDPKLADATFVFLGDFRDSEFPARYYAALCFESQLQYETAATYLDDIPFFRDSMARLASYDGLIAQRDAARQDAQNAAACADAAAYTFFLAPGDYSDSAARAHALTERGKYAIATSCVSKGQFQGAYTLFTGLGDYEDSSEKAHVLSVSTFAQVTDYGDCLAKFQYRNKWSFINVNTCTVTSPIWDSVSAFDKNGLAMVSRNGRYGFIDATGDVVIPASYVKVNPFSEGLAAVKMGNCWRYIDLENNTVIKGDYQEATSFSGDRADVFLKDVGWQIIDNQGNLICFVSNKTLLTDKAAVQLMEEGKYEDARHEFLSISGYRDSAALMDECINLNIEARYQYAASLIDVINYAEACNDFGTIYARGSTSKVHTRFNASDKNKKTVQTIRIELPDNKPHTICITYQKNSWKDENNDSLQFKVRFN